MTFISKQSRAKLNSHKVDVQPIGKLDSESNHLLLRWENVSHLLPQLCLVALALQNIASNGLLNHMDSKLDKFMDNAHLEGRASSLEGRIRVQNMSLTLEEWIKISVVKFIEDSCKEIWKARRENERQ